MGEYFEMQRKITTFANIYRSRLNNQLIKESGMSMGNFDSLVCHKLGRHCLPNFF